MFSGDYGVAKNVAFESKMETDLYEFVKCKTFITRFVQDLNFRLGIQIKVHTNVFYKSYQQWAHFYKTKHYFNNQIYQKMIKKILLD